MRFASSDLDSSQLPTGILLFQPNRSEAPSTKRPLSDLGLRAIRVYLMKGAIFLENGVELVCVKQWIAESHDGTMLYWWFELCCSYLHHPALVLPHVRLGSLAAWRLN